MRLLTPEETAQRLGGISPRSLADKRYRARIGLYATKVGKRLMFAENDVERLITHGREKLPLPIPKGTHSRD